MTEVTRRQAIAISAMTLVLAGCAPEPMPTPTHSPSPTPIGPPDWDALAAKLNGTLLRAGQAGYQTARLVENPRYDDARPLAVLTAASAADVAAGVAFAANYGIPLALRSGGHSYTGYSSGGAAGTGMPPSLVIDTRGMRAVALNSDGSASIQAGASLAQVYSAIGSRGRSIAAGSCATVGVTGLVLGGGVGVMVREYGLSCDALTEIELVTADGQLRTVNPQSDPELFWACQGGGGGHLGVVTKLTLATRPAPPVTMWSLRWPFAAAASVITAWQDWAPNADRRLWSTLKLLNGANHTDGPGLYLSGTWLGPESSLAGRLSELIQAVGSAPTRRGAAQHEYLDAMMRYAGCGGIPLARCTTDAGGVLKRESSAATSHVPTERLDSADIATLLAKVEAASAVPGIREGGISMDALGGAVGDLGPGDTAFPHRGAIMTVQYTATFPDGTDPAPLDAYVRGFREAMVPSWAEAAYINYADAGIRNPAMAYFGDNAARLAQVKRAYDPDNLFAQPQGY